LRRVALLGGAVPLGLLTGLMAWLMAGGLSTNGDVLEEVQTSLGQLRPPAAANRVRAYSGAADLLASPLFALTTGPGAVREPSIRVDGVAVSRRRIAALLSIDGKPAEWLSVGESRDGVTLQSVTSSSITVETVVGAKALNLGDQSAASAPAPGADQAASPTPAPAVDQMPSGFRSPPEPASAPGVR
jgi:hypothetical protein